jgi:hypothetical protein
MSTLPIRRRDREAAWLVWLSAWVSLLSFLFYFRRGDILLYGDAVAHINIARRVFDSRTPGLLQLGTVWLPLPHLLTVPFLLSDWMWKSGVGASIPSMAAYVVGTVGIFRLVRDTLHSSQTGNMARGAAWGAAIIYAANPNLLYLQATAMTEALYLALFIWAVAYFNEFAMRRGDNENPSAGNGASLALLKCGLCLSAASLTRYDGWFLAAATSTACFVMALRASQNANHNEKHGYLKFDRGVRTFFLLAAAVPVLWLAYNAIVYRNPLEFANGPYSARAIELRTPHASHPGSYHLGVAFRYFLKSAELNQASGEWQKVWILLAVAGTLVCLVGRTRRAAGSRVSSTWGQGWPLLLLWIPLPFYALSVAYGGVPIFMPVWWPFSYYNVRYGLELLPAFAVFSTLAVSFLVSLTPIRALRLAWPLAAVAFIAVSYASIWRDPVCFREAWNNSRTRLGLERELADFVAAFPPHATLLMYLGDHVGALQQAGVPLRRVINEGNHRTWKQPVDLAGLWERALADPARYTDFVVAFEGDPVSAGLQTRDLFPLAVIHVSGQAKATIYQTHPPAR